MSVKDSPDSVWRICCAGQALSNASIFARANPRPDCSIWSAASCSTSYSPYSTRFSRDYSNLTVRRPISRYVAIKSPLTFSAAGRARLEQLDHSSANFVVVPRHDCRFGHLSSSFPCPGIDRVRGGGWRSLNIIVRIRHNPIPTPWVTDGDWPFSIAKFLETSASAFGLSRVMLSVKIVTSWPAPEMET
jgi:hypothetical protein